MFSTSQELESDIADRARGLRLAQNLTQIGMAERSGVPLGTIKKFERHGGISLASLLKLSIALDASEAFKGLFSLPSTTETVSLDELLKAAKQRKRGRRR